MATLSKRSAVQEFFEAKVGCTIPGTIGDYTAQLEGLTLTLGDEAKLHHCLVEDIQGFFERSALTLLQACLDLERGDRLWSAVKLYYAVFYALRVELNLASIAIVRGKRTYSCICKQGAKLRKYNGNQTGDHSTSIDINRRDIGAADILLGSSIDDTSPYMWLKGVRDKVQYKLRRPPEITGFNPFFDEQQISIPDQVKIFLGDPDPYYPFDPDFAALALPVKRFQLTAKAVAAAGIPLDAEFIVRASAITSTGESPALFKPYLGL